MARHRRFRCCLTLAIGLYALACAPPDPGILTISGSALGTERVVLETQIARFRRAHPDLRVEIRVTPDAADQRHQLFVQWLNARASDPDVLQLDVIWTPEFAAAGWILPLDGFTPDLDAFFPATVAANEWRGRFYALPWFVDVGMLYWRTDLMANAPASLDTLIARARLALAGGEVDHGFVWQGARYEGLITVFVEFLGAFGGRILDETGAVVVDDEAAVRALTAMRDMVHVTGITPEAALTWQEEQVRFAFQNGTAAFMRNWPYAAALLADTAASRVAGRFAVAPLPAADGGQATAALGGAQLAINARSGQPDKAYALIRYLLEPAQMLERARITGQYPTRFALYDSAALAGALVVPPAAARRVIERAVPRPVTPVYTQLSGILQVHVHRALTRQREPRQALRNAAAEMRTVLDRAGLAGEGAR